ncbi:MAG: hypothetical protein ABJM29_04230 [Rhizobiaceae bacterium]
MTKPRRSSRDIHSVLQNLRAGRSGAISVCMSARINSTEYAAAGAVVEAVDDLVTCLTGDHRLLHASAHRTRTGSKQSHIGEDD